MSLFKYFRVSSRLNLLPVSFCTILSPCLWSIYDFSIVKIEFQVNFFKLVMALCFSRRLSIFIITLTATAGKGFLFLCLVYLNFNRLYTLRFIKLIHLHYLMMRWSWGFMMHKYLT